MLKDNPLHVAFHVGRVIYGHLWSSMVILMILAYLGHDMFLCLVNGQRYALLPGFCSLSEMAARGPDGGVLGVHFPVRAPRVLSRNSELF